MKLLNSRTIFAGSRASQRGFTMVEIALCLGIIVFALVAIIGVLPTGMKVQQENAEDTMVNQDGAYLIEAIRTGARGLDELTNYVESITINSNQGGGAIASVVYTNGPVSGRVLPLVSAQQIVGLLCTPKYEIVNGVRRINQVTALVRSMTGAASFQGRNHREFALRYRVQVELMAFEKRPPGWLESPISARQQASLRQSLYELRLRVSWPVLSSDASVQTGKGRKTFRTLMSGELVRANFLGVPIYVFQPNTFNAAL